LFHIYVFICLLKNAKPLLAKHEFCLKLALPDLDKRKLLLKVKNPAFRK